MPSVIKIVLLFLMSAGSLQAQDIYESYRPNALDSILRQKTDTTLVFRLKTYSTTDPPIHYLSKKGDTITLYRYGTNFKPKILMPEAMNRAVYLAQKDWEISKNGITLNRFFNALDVPQKELRLLWKNIMALKPGTMQDDKAAGMGCPLAKDVYDLYDGGGIILDILTAKEVKHFYFYAPAYYEEKCPGRESRKRILAIQKLLAPYVQFWNN